MLVPRDYKIARTNIKRELCCVREQGGANTSSATSMNTVQGLLLVSLPLHSVSLSSRALKPKCPRICTLHQNTRYIHNDDDDDDDDDDNDDDDDEHVTNIYQLGVQNQ